MTRARRAHLARACVIMGLAAKPVPAHADVQDDAAIRLELKALRERIDQLERALAQRAPRDAPPGAIPIVATGRAIPAPLPPVQTDSSSLGEVPLNSARSAYWRVPGTATDLRVSGYIRFGAFKDLVDNLGSYKFRSGDIHRRGDPLRAQRGNIQAQLRLSRISLDTKTPTRLGELRTTLALDFAGAEPKSYQAEALQNNGFHLRLTHAYASLGPFSLAGVRSELLIGQTWSTFLDDPDTAESIDPSGPAGVPSARQPQLRYTARFGEHALSLALENPIGEYQLPGSAAGANVNNVSTTNRWPDMAAKYEVEAGWGRAQLSGVLRLFAVDDGRGGQGSAVGYGVIAGGTLNLAGPDKVGGQLWWGDGIGRYVPDEFGVPNGFAVRPVAGAVEVRTQRTAGGSLWLRHFWAAQWRSNLALGYARQRYAPFVVPSPDQAPLLRTALFNLIHTPLPVVDVGVELEYGLKSFRPELGLRTADALRLGFSSRVKFN